MAFHYRVISSSPSVNGTHINALTGGDNSWKTASNPAFVLVQLDEPLTLSRISLCNAGSAIVEILGLPSDVPSQGTAAKDHLYKTVVQGTTLASPADWKAQKNVDEEKEWTTFDEDAQGVVFSQLKVVLRGYGSGKPLGMKTLKIEGKKHKQGETTKMKTNSLSLASLAMEEESDEDADELPSMKTAASSILQDRLAELKTTLQKEETQKPAEEAITPSAPIVPFVVRVANEDEFDPNYEANKMIAEEAPKPKRTVSRPPKDTPAAPAAKPFAHVVLSVSGIGPERAEIRSTVAELGGTYSHDLPTTSAPGQQLILLVDASSDQWHHTPKHQQAVAQDVPIVDKSWLTACKKKNQYLAVGPYLYQFRTGDGKSSASSAATGASTAPSVSKAPSALPSAPASKPKKGTIKAEGGSYSTDKPAKGDEVESDGPDEYVFDDFVVDDDDEIEYYDDADYHMDIDEVPHHHHKKSNKPVKIANTPARTVFTPHQLEQMLSNWKKKCSSILGKKFEHMDEDMVAPGVFGMDVDNLDAASDGTNPIDEAELAELNRDL